MSTPPPLDASGVNVDGPPSPGAAQSVSSFFDADQLHSAVWEPLRHVSVALFFFLTLSSFAVPSLVALLLFRYLWDAPEVVVATARFIEIDDHLFSPLVDYWPVIPGLGAGLAIAYPERRKQIITLIFLIMLAVVVSSSAVLYQQSYLDDADRTALVTTVLSHLNVDELPENLHRLGALVERSRDVAIAFLSALVGAAVGGAQQRRAQS